MMLAMLEVANTHMQTRAYRARIAGKRWADWLKSYRQEAGPTSIGPMRMAAAPGLFDWQEAICAQRLC